MKISATKNISNKDKNELLSGLKNITLILLILMYGMIWVFVHNDSGELYGGLIGKRKGDWFCIDFLWVAEGMRGKKLGSEIMIAAEIRMRNEGCSYLQVDTFSFQALPFYEKLGFKLNNTIDNFPHEGMKRYYLIKQL